MRSHWVVSPLQLLMVPVQPAKPGGSGSRFRKSRYCCRTKKFVLSIELGPVVVSLSTIITVVVDGVPSAAPVGLLRLTVKLSVPSAYESSMIATENDFEVSPEAKVTVPMVLMKSQRGEATPLKTLQFCKPAASLVAKPTLDTPEVLPDRVTVRFTR